MIERAGVVGVEEISVLLASAEMEGWKKIIFMAYCCERMLPNFQRFNVETGFGDIGVLRGALDSVWCWAETDATPFNLAQIVASCESQAPDTAEFSSIYTSSALDAATAIAITVASVGFPVGAQLLEVSKLANDTVDLFMQLSRGLNPNDSCLDEIIGSSDLMQGELWAQRSSFEVLQRCSLERSVVARRLRGEWSRLAEGSLHEKPRF